jgi:hypothetical protein
MKLILFLGILALSTAALAQTDDCDLPPNAYEVEVWKYVDGVWVSEDLNMPCATGRLWASRPLEGECNKRCWEIPVTIHASIAQWIKFDVTGTRWDWRIMKPGIYAGDCIEFEICSNGDVGVDYDEFGDLLSDDSCTPEIMTWYAWGRSIPEIEDRDGWVRAPELNEIEDIIEETCEGGHCWTTKLWTKVKIDSCHSACEYHDEALVTLCLINQKCWVDEDGSWWDRIVCVRD